MRIQKKELAKKLSVVLTEQVSPEMTTVYSLVSTGRTPYTDFIGRLSDDDRKVIDEALKVTGAYELRDRFVSELSDGERQKVMIARALVQEPQLIILDEPTSHLDIRHKVEVIRILQELSEQKGITSILSLHDIDLAIKGCQTVMLVSEGKISASGSPEEIITSGVIQKLYGISGAVYNELMGSVEISGKGSNDIFCTGGNGTGVKCYRSLARNGFGITSGVIHENDRDFDAASGICGSVISEKAFEEITAENVSRAESIALAAKCVIDSGFPIGKINGGNIMLIKNLISKGKDVISLRSYDESVKIFGEYADKMQFAENTSKLCEIVKNRY
jgi:iron complex transport system ATP-binding protein